MTAQFQLEAARLVELGDVRVGALPYDGLDHYAVAMTDTDGNEFDIN